MRVLVLLVTKKSLGPGGRADGGCPGPSPSSPALVILTSKPQGIEQDLLLETRGIVDVWRRCTTARRQRLAPLMSGNARVPMKGAYSNPT
jgi:hypothetical protein